MKKNVFLAIIIFITLNTWSQYSKTDSLTTLIDKSESNKEKISLLLKRSKSYKPVEIDLPYKDAELALQLADKENNNQLKVDALLQIAAINSRKNNFEKALEICQNANEIAKNDSYALGELNAVTGIGRNLVGLGKDGQAIPFLEKAKELAKTNNNSKELKNIFNILGISYRKIGKLNQSLNVFNDAISMIDAKKESKLLALLFMNKANTLNELNRYNEAIDNHLNSLTIFESNKDIKGIMQINNNLVPLFIKVSQWEKAKFYAQKTKQFLDQNPNDFSKGQLFDNFSLILENLHQKDSILFYRQQSLFLFQNIGDQYNIARITNNIGNYYLQNGNLKNAEKKLVIALTLRNKLASKKDIAETQLLLTSTYLGMKNIKTAEKYFLLAKPILEKEPLSQKENFLKISKEFYAQTGEIEKALEESNKLIVLKDSLFKEGELVTLLSKENNYQLLKKDNEIKLSKEFKTKFNNNRIVYGMLLFLVFLLALYSFIRWKKSDLNKNKIELEKLKIESQKQTVVAEHLTTLEELKNIKKWVVEDHIMLKNNAKIYLKELIYIKSEDHYLEFHTLAKKEFLRGTISEILSQLPPNFEQTHRSFIINKNYIISMNSNDIILKNDIEIPLTRKFKENFKS
jgi:tetratricopeptide (TPR) repeat protein